MKPMNIAVAAIGAVVIGAAGYLAGVELSGRGPSAAVAESAVKEYLAAHPDVLVPGGASAPPGAAAPTTEVAAMSDTERSEIEGVIKNYLMTNPEIVRDAIDELQRRQDQAEQADRVKAIADNSDLLFASTRQVVLGNPKGNVTLVEFFDYNCGYCKRAHADMVKLMEEDKDLRVVLKEFPVLGEGSVEAAQVSIAVRILAPEKSGEFFDALLSVNGQVNGAKAIAVAEDLGLDAAKIRETIKSDEVKQTIGEAYSLATNLSLTGTPSYVTAQEVVVGAVGYDALKAKIAEARTACASANC